MPEPVGDSLIQTTTGAMDMFTLMYMYHIYNRARGKKKTSVRALGSFTLLLPRLKCYFLTTQAE